MKRNLPFFTLLALLIFTQGAFAWTYDGLGSLNPFTNFGRGYGNSNCGCQQVQNQCCENQQNDCYYKNGKRHLTFGRPAGYAVPVYVPCDCNDCGAVPIIYDENCPCNIPLQPLDNCNNPCSKKY